MILDYPHNVDFSSNKSLRRFRRWLSYRMAKYITCIKEKEETDKFFKDPENRTVGCDFREAKKNIKLIEHYHWAITEILKTTQFKNNERNT